MPWIALNLHLYCSHVFTLIVHYRSIKISKFSKGVSLHSHFTLDLGNIYFCCSNILFFVKSLLETVAKLSSLLGTATAAAAAKSLQSFPTLCDPIDGSPPGSPIPGILQARTLEWVAIAFSNAWKWKVKVKSFGHVRLLATPWTAAYQAPPSVGFSRQEYWSGVPSPSPGTATRLQVFQSFKHYSLKCLQCMQEFEGNENGFSIALFLVLIIYSCIKITLNLVVLKKPLLLLLLLIVLVVVFFTVLGIAWAQLDGCRLGYFLQLQSAGAEVIWKISLLRCLPLDVCCWLRPHLGLSPKGVHVVFLCGLNCLIPWHLGSKSKGPKRSREPDESLLGYSLGKLYSINFIALYSCA